MLVIYLLPVAFPHLRVALNDLTAVFIREPVIETEGQLKKENRIFREKIERQNLALAQVENLKIDNQTLRKAQKLSVGKGYNLRLLSILKRHPVTWNERFTLSKTKNDFIPVGSSVLIEGKLAGKVTVAGKTTVDVETLLSDNVEVACVIKGTQWFGLLKGAGFLEGMPSTELICVLDNLPRDVEIKPGSLVYTSGVGVLPGGIEIARVLKTERNEIKQKAYVRISAPLNSARFANLLLRNDE